MSAYDHANVSQYIGASTGMYPLNGIDLPHL